MSSKTISIKRHNHRIHPCDQTQKADLLNFLIAQNSGTNILVVTANDTEAVKNLLNDASIVVANDSELAKSAELQGDLLISYDLPNSAVSYMLRLSRAKTHAIILLDEYQHKQLYSIERLIERTIMQEMVKGFEPAAVIAAEREKQSRADRMAARDAAESQNSNNSDRKRSDRGNRDAKRPQNSKSSYMGKDEDGKSMFSGKSGERNHRYDGTPKSDEEKQKSGKKPFNKSRSYDDKKPKKSYGDSSKPRSSYDGAKDSAPKRAPRQFGVKSIKPSEKSK